MKRALRMTGLAKTKMVGKATKPVTVKTAPKSKSKKSPAPGA